MTLTRLILVTFFFSVPVFGQVPPHGLLCEALAAHILTGQGPRAETDDYVRSLVCQNPLPPQREFVNRGVNTTYVLSSTPVEALWHPDAAVAQAAFATICPMVPPTNPAPNIIELVRSSGDQSAVNALNDCLVKAYDNARVACDIFVESGQTRVSLHRLAPLPASRITNITINGASIPGVSMPLPLSPNGLASLHIGGALASGRNLKITLDDGSSCEVKRFAAPDKLEVRIGAFGKGLTCPPAAVFNLDDSRGDDCGSDHHYRSRRFELAANLRKRPGTFPSSSRYSSNCPDGASHIDSLHSDPSDPYVTAAYRLKGCGFTKAEVPIGPIKLSAEWCNGRSWLGERIAVPIVELSGTQVLEPETSSLEIEEWTWGHLAYFSTLMAEDFISQGFDWQATITYKTLVAPGPSRTATLSPGSPVFVDTQEKRCFVAFFDQPSGGLMVLSPRTMGECTDSSYGSKYKEILKVGDPCSKRRENGLPTTSDLSKCHSKCD